MLSLIRLCFDHLENGAGEEHLWEVDCRSGPGSFEHVCRATISAGPPVGDMKRMSPRRNSREAGGAKCRTLKQIHEKLKNLHQVSTPPCIIGLV